MSQYFGIRSKQSGLMVDVEGSNPKPGAWVSMFPQNGTDAQMWRDDPATGTIRNKINGFCFDIEGGRIVLNPYQVGKADQLWERKDGAIVDRRDAKLVLEMDDSNKGERAKIIKAKASGSPSQSWTFELV